MFLDRGAAFFGGEGGGVDVEGGYGGGLVGQFWGAEMGRLLRGERLWLWIWYLTMTGDMMGVGRC